MNKKPYAISARPANMNFSRALTLLTALTLFFNPPVSTAADPPLAELYMKILVEGTGRALEAQSDDGRYNSSVEMKNKPQARLDQYAQMAIYPVAYLYKTSHPLNPYSGQKRLLDSAIACGDLLSGYESETVWPLGNWTLYAWIEAFDLIKDSLGVERKAAWTERIKYWVGHYLGYVQLSRGKRNYTAVELGVSPNHYSLYVITVFRAGQVFGHPEWVKLVREEYKNLLRTQHPDGYWAEHHGPVNSYNRVTTHGVGLYYALTGDPEALEALRRAKDFNLRFTYPDGSAVSVIDERNRYSPGIKASWGLLGHSHFPDGRRYNRLMTLKLMERMGLAQDGSGKVRASSGRKPSFLDLTWILDNLKYSAAGDESPAPQEIDSYEARLISGAYLLRRGSWIVCLSGIVSPPWEGNRFFLDRYTYLEVWHEKLGVVIGGGNTKRQPQIAGLLMEPSHSALDFRPRESRITCQADTLVLELGFDKFRARKKVAIIDDRTVKITVDFTETTQPILWPNRYECNLQLQLKAGEQISTAAGQNLALSNEKRHYLEEQIGSGIETAQWSFEVPQGKTSLRFPFLPFSNYNIDGIGSPATAVGILSSYTTNPDESFEYTLRIK